MIAFCIEMQFGASVQLQCVDSKNADVCTKHLRINVAFSPFSYVILEIGGIYQRDAGLYTCKAVNKHGEASVSCTLTVKVLDIA